MPTRKDPLKGTNINDLLDIGPDVISKLTRSELSRVVSRLASAANKRLRRMNKAGLNVLNDKMFGAKGKDIYKLRSEYKRLYNFFNRKAYNSVTSARKFKDKTIERLVSGTNIDPETVTDNDIARFFQLFSSLHENGILSQIGLAYKPTLQSKLFQIYVEDKTITFGEFVDKLGARSTAEYEELEEDMTDGVAQWFDI